MTFSTFIAPDNTSTPTSTPTPTTQAKASGQLSLSQLFDSKGSLSRIDLQNWTNARIASVYRELETCKPEDLSRIQGRLEILKALLHGAQPQHRHPSITR